MRQPGIEPDSRAVVAGVNPNSKMENIMGSAYLDHWTIGANE